MKGKKTKPKKVAITPLNLDKIESLNESAKELNKKTAVSVESFMDYSKSVKIKNNSLLTSPMSSNSNVYSFQ